MHVVTVHRITERRSKNTEEVNTGTRVLREVLYGKNSGMNQNTKAPFFPIGDSDLENRKPTVDFCPSKRDKGPYT